MHGLLLKSFQLLVTSLYGQSVWHDITDTAATGFHNFEATQKYSRSVGDKTLKAAQAVLQRPLPELFEDLGTFLVSDPDLEPIRRLMRFGGYDFTEFLHSLDDMPDRARLAFPDFDWPLLELREHTACHFTVICQSDTKYMGFLIVGVLRTMADDYGALAMVEHRSSGQGIESLSVTLLEPTFTDGRDFLLGALAE